MKLSLIYTSPHTSSNGFAFVEVRRDFVRLPQAKASRRQRWGIFRQVNFIASSANGSIGSGRPLILLSDTLIIMPNDSELLFKPSDAFLDSLHEFLRINRGSDDSCVD